MCLKLTQGASQPGCRKCSGFCKSNDPLVLLQMNQIPAWPKELNPMSREHDRRLPENKQDFKVN